MFVECRTARTGMGCFGRLRVGWTDQGRGSYDHVRGRQFQSIVADAARMKNWDGKTNKDGDNASNRSDGNGWSDDESMERNSSVCT